VRYQALFYAEEVFDEQPTEEMVQEVKALRVSCILNRMMCNLKLGRNDRVVEDGDSLLEMDVSDIQRTKIYYRKGCAYMAMKEFESSISSLEEASKLDPSDKLIQRELTIAKNRVIERKEKEKMAFSKMFG
jgi:peptidyl-prolyl isomerase D